MINKHFQARFFSLTRKILVDIKKDGVVELGIKYSEEEVEK
jgi:hypothetical protein